MRKSAVFLGAVFLAALIMGGGLAQAEPLIVGNSVQIGSTDSGPILTYNFATGGDPVAFYFPNFGFNGRGLAVNDRFLYYTEAGLNLGPSDGIHIALWNNGFPPGPDIGVIPNPAPTSLISSLAYFNGSLYSLSGVVGNAPVVTQFDRNSGAVIDSFAINTIFSDGSQFTVLPNGNFLINANGIPTYTEYSRADGNSTGFSITLPGSPIAFGVDLSPDGTALYFATIISVNSFIKTDLAGNFQGSIAYNPLSFPGPSDTQFEDIGLVQPFDPNPVPLPPSVLLLGSGLVSLGFWRRRWHNTK